MLAAWLLPIAMAVSPIRAVDIRVEGHALNNAVMGDTALIEWRVEDPRPNARQSGYEVHISPLPAIGDDRRTSGQKSDSTKHLFRLFDGTEDRFAYFVFVRLTDKDGMKGEWSDPVPFRTLKLDKSWKAKWIQAQIEVPPVVKAHNGYHSEMEKNPDVEKWIEIDLGGSRELDTIRLFPADPIDWSPRTRGLLFPLRYRVEVDGKVVVDRTDEDQPIPGGPSARVSFDPVKGRKVRVVFTKLRERNPGYFGVALAEITVGDGSSGAKASAKDSIENSLWSVKNLTDGDLTSHGVQGYESLPVQYLAKEFDLVDVPPRAIFHVACLGAYVLSVNGKRISDAALSPDWTDYHSRVGVQTFEVADFLRKGRNRIDIVLGDGWYAGRLGMSQALHPDNRPRGVYGRVPMIRAELEVEPVWDRRDNEEGVAGVKVFTDSSWLATTDGPVRTSDHLDGEVVDANAVLLPLDQGNWKPVRIGKPVKEPKLDPQIAEPIKVTQTVKPISQKTLPDGRVVIDFGQNLVGRARFRLKGEPYEKVTVRYAEMLNEDGSAYFANLRGAPQIDTFFTNGKWHWFGTHFTYHGFRYAELTAFDRSGQANRALKGQKIEAVAEVFHTAAPETASFACSEPMFERLWQNVVWTQRANLMSTPTDCPQRDERLGWTGDIHAYGQTGCYIMDLRNFWRKWLIDMRDAQADDGRYPDFAPHPYGKNDRFTGVPGWGDAGVICTQTAWRNYADERLVQDMLPSILRWLDWIHSKNPDFIWRNARHNDYGDWLNGDTLVQEGWPKQGAEVPKDVFATLMWYQSATAALEMLETAPKASLIDRGPDGKPKRSKYEEMAERVRQAFLGEFVDADGKIKGDTQAGYAIALGIDILPEELRPKAFAHLLQAVERAKNHISTGFHSTHHLMQVLTRFGRSDVAYMLLSNRTFPGWGYSIEQGATTIWERWDGYVKGRGFQDPGMNSFNHWAFGSVGEWMMGTIIGIRPGSPGWLKFVVAPEPGANLTWAKGHYDSPQGRIEVSWKVEADELKIDVMVPANTKAEMRFPAGWAPSGDKELSAGKHSFALTRNR